jgi:hypothetical protein
MGYQGDILAGALLDFKFQTLNTSAVPTTLSGTPALSVYKNNSTTESTAGVTLTVDFDGRTGCNHARIDTSADGAFYAAGNNYQVVITAGTVNGVSVVGAIAGEFSIENRKTILADRAQGGPAATLNLKSVFVYNDSGDAVVFAGIGVGLGISSSGSHAVQFVATGLAGSGLSVESLGDGNPAVAFTPGTGADAFDTDGLQAIGKGALGTAIPGSFAAGTAGYVLNAIKTKTDQIGSAAVTITAPVDPNDDSRLTLTQGDDHTSGSGLPSWTVTNWTGPALKTTGKLRLLSIEAYRQLGTNAVADLEVDATITTSGSTLTITAPITAAQSALLASYPPGDQDTHQYQVVGSRNDNNADVSLVLSKATVNRRVDPAP